MPPVDSRPAARHRGSMQTADPVRRPSIDEIRGARTRIVDAAIRTPLIPLTTFGQDRGGLWLKPECLQPIGSFKIRGAANALALAPPDELERGVYTASAGNMAQGVAFAAGRLGLQCRVIVPDSAPRAKTDAIQGLGGEVIRVPYDEWWRVLVEHGHPAEQGFFVHPVSDPHVIAGNGTVGLEILEDLPDADAIVVPYGGGGLSCGIAAAIRGSGSSADVFASEVDTAAPLAASLAAGHAVAIDRISTFVDGIGGSSVLPDMWPMACDLLSGSLVTTVDEICEAIRILAFQAHLIAEGAGATSVAAALEHLTPDRRIVAVVSGGNVDTDVLGRILTGRAPH